MSWNNSRIKWVDVISDCLNIFLGIFLVVLFGMLLASVRVQPWEPNKPVALIELLLGVSVLSLGLWRFATGLTGRYYT